MNIVKRFNLDFMHAHIHTHSPTRTHTHTHTHTQDVRTFGVAAFAMSTNHPLLPAINQRMVEYNDDGMLLLKERVKCRHDDKDQDFHNLQQSLHNMWVVFLCAYSLAGLAILVSAVQALSLTQCWAWFANVKNTGFPMSDKVRTGIDEEQLGYSVPSIGQKKVSPATEPVRVKY